MLSLSFPGTQLPTQSHTFAAAARDWNWVGAGAQANLGQDKSASQYPQNTCARISGQSLIGSPRGAGRHLDDLCVRRVLCPGLRLICLLLLGLSQHRVTGDHQKLGGRHDREATQRRLGIRIRGIRNARDLGEGVKGVRHQDVEGHHRRAQRTAGAAREARERAEGEDAKHACQRAQPKDCPWEPEELGAVLPRCDGDERDALRQLRNHNGVALAVVLSGSEPGQADDPGAPEQEAAEEPHDGGARSGAFHLLQGLDVFKVAPCVLLPQRCYLALYTDAGVHTGCGHEGLSVMTLAQ
eukprot:TRINITY_DN1749_c0_g1_i7.p1 TRINITY_DN1749_c0_g1~~TRINITY_DN1749_c0_g1_i7.p1  ORF type:complete len:297 (+),score=21.22 TRINITY_DN1749_c0_g1_i7:389-1279(+)